MLLRACFAAPLLSPPPQVLAGTDGPWGGVQTLNEFLAVFWHLLCYADPELWWHLDELHFKPDLFAIPW
jgi:hypothetical protein